MRKAIVYASVHHGITLIFEQKENRGFYSSVFRLVRLAAHVSNGLKSRIRPVVGRI